MRRSICSREPLCRALPTSRLVRLSGWPRPWLPSWPAPLPALLRIPIDHVLVGGDLLVTAPRLGPAFGSDHLPLLAAVQIPR